MLTPVISFYCCLKHQFWRFYKNFACHLTSKRQSPIGIWGVESNCARKNRGKTKRRLVTWPLTFPSSELLSPSPWRSRTFLTSWCLQKGALLLHLLLSRHSSEPRLLDVSMWKMNVSTLLLASESDFLLFHTWKGEDTNNCLNLQKSYLYLPDFVASALQEY